MDCGFIIFSEITSYADDTGHRPVNSASGLFPHLLKNKQLETVLMVEKPVKVEEPLVHHIVIL